MSTVNPIVVVKNNLPAYKAELLNERDKLTARIAKIDAEVQQCDDLLKVLGVDGAEVADVDAPCAREIGCLGASGHGGPCWDAKGWLT